MFAYVIFKYFCLEKLWKDNVNILYVNICRGMCTKIFMVHTHKSKTCIFKGKYFIFVLKS